MYGLRTQSTHVLQLPLHACGVCGTYFRIAGQGAGTVRVGATVPRRDVTCGRLLLLLGACNQAPPFHDKPMSMEAEPPGGGEERGK